MAHYMPWYEADAAAHRWGWHWTMNHFQPDQVTDGKRAIASHYYPLIGPYDSNDPDVLEYHTLLMKFAGIDGVIIDWYGPDDYLDYKINDRNTRSLITFAQKAGMKYTVMYEDQTVPKLRDAHLIPNDDVIAHGQRLVQGMQKDWFTDPAFLTTAGNPTFMVFGSGFYTGDQWKTIFSALPKPPTLFTESYQRLPAVGGFYWPQPGGGTDGALSDLDKFYTQAKTWPEFIAGAFPRFDDIYVAAGIHPSWGHVDDRNGTMYTQTLERALQSKARVIQLITWNDWGEGTVIEPSVEYGYRDLEATQRLRRKYTDPHFRYIPQDLRLPIALYNLRKRYKDNAQESVKLDRISRLLFAGRLTEARPLLAGYRKLLPDKPKDKP